jgi:hypothetical protein
MHAGMTHAGKIATVICGKNSFRLTIDGDTIAEVPRTGPGAFGSCSPRSFAIWINAEARSISALLHKATPLIARSGMGLG